MESGDITEIIITLRPTKLAFVVDPEEEGDFNRAIQASLLLWGGIYNPIIPAYKNLPYYWSDPYIPNLSADIVCKGYIRHFDPDIVVLCGNIAESQVPEHVKHRIRLDELACNLSQGGVPTIGTDLLEVLQSFARKEFRFSTNRAFKTVVVFSTMKDEFSEEEKRLLSSFVQNGKYDVLLLTKKEHYSNIALNIPNNFYPNVLRNLCDETVKQHLERHET
ncbi:hypothetical protein EM20IM_09175 [Candidatus Methylacidiphilum infernorum]|uniref:DUF218 domain-containing protein n=1 Tax=Candidatus Methylacidiphilum infernorum TaxID=511746 RepID=A0ABX7PUR1_9BACT|nr:hypothetical protein [Candidatus Methylacidiphilum infernorum]QSR86637.1 hypothetical protein EM20IM_09175 [Candidatus Methylacidiphilum infernorum]